MVSMALAFCLWLSLAGLETGLVDFTVGLRLHSLPDHLVIKGEMPKSLTLRVRANAAQVRFLSDRNLSLPLDLSLAQEGYNSFPVLLDLLNLPRGVEVAEINPAAIEFEVMELFQKEVPVKPKVVGRPAPDFRLENLVLEPAAVTIQGPPDILAQVDHLETSPLALEGLTRDAVFSIGLVQPEAAAVTIVGAKEIQATVSVSEIRTQAVFSGIPVEVEIEARSRDHNSLRRIRGPFGRPDNNLDKDSPAAGEGPASFIAQPARVSVTISWPSSRSRPVDAREVRARVGVDAEQLKTEGRITVPVVVVPPSGASVVDISPAMVGVSHVPPAAETSRIKVKP
jgi:hypothetical protein